MILRTFACKCMCSFTCGFANNVILLYSKKYFDSNWSSDTCEKAMDAKSSNLNRAIKLVSTIDACYLSYRQMISLRHFSVKSLKFRAFRIVLKSSKNVWKDPPSDKANIILVWHVNREVKLFAKLFFFLFDDSRSLLIKSNEAKIAI